MKWSLSFLSLFFAFAFISCGGDDDYIPPAIEEPDQPEPEETYNTLNATPHKDGDPYDSYEGLVMAGYQGWFGAPGDGCKHNDAPNTVWYHYRESEVFKPGVLQNSIDFWPDVSEYEKTYETSFTLPDGNPAFVFSSYDKSSVLLHFKWMKEYGIDGVFMQRFVGEVVNNEMGKDHFNKVLASAMEGSNTYQRAICIMYDLGGFSGSDATRGADAVFADLQELESMYHMKDRSLGQKYYLYENGKPLVSLWGVGFSGTTAYTTDDVEKLVTLLKDNGYSVMLGVPAYWRSGTNDAEAGSKLKNLIKKVDVIMPWYVGRFSNDSYSSFKTVTKDDISWCKTNNVGYAPMLYVGSSDRNMHPNNGYQPRLKGEFYWKQAYADISYGAQMFYIAMFDEIDEGTAIFKVLEKSDVPSNVANPDYWVLYENGQYSKRSTEKQVTGENDWCRKANDLGIEFQGIEDGLGTDFYLWLVGRSRLMLRGEIAMSSETPTRN
jgi:hypothetical protein